MAESTASAPVVEDVIKTRTLCEKTLLKLYHKYCHPRMRGSWCGALGDSWN